MKLQVRYSTSRLLRKARESPKGGDRSAHQLAPNVVKRLFSSAMREIEKFLPELTLFGIPAGELLEPLFIITNLPELCHSFATT